MIWQLNNFLFAYWYFDVASLNLHLPNTNAQAGDSSAEELANATQVQGPYLPIVRDQPAIELVKITDEMKSFKAYGKLRIERTNARHFGARLKRAAEAEKEEKK